MEVETQLASCEKFAVAVQPSASVIVILHPDQMAANCILYPDIICTVTYV